MRSTQEIIGNINFNRVAVAASVAAIAITGARGSIEVAQADSQGSGSDLVALCESEALSSFAGGEMSFDSTDGLVTQEVSASALPDNCNGQVWRTVSVQQLAGPNLSSLSPNTINQDLVDGLSSFDDTVQQAMNQPFACGTDYEQQVTVFTMPTVESSDPSETQTYESAAAEVDCPPVPGPVTPTPTPTPSPAPTPQPENSVTSQQIKQCEIDADYSFAGGAFKYTRPVKGKYDHVIQTISVNALPVECDGIVNRTVAIETKLGKPGHLKPDTSLEIISASNSKFVDHIKQTLKRAWRPGEQTQQVIKVTATPSSQYQQTGVASESKTYYSNAA